MTLANFLYWIANAVIKVVLFRHSTWQTGEFIVSATDRFTGLMEQF